EDRTSATASRLNSSVYRLLRLLLLPTWHYFLWNLTSQSQVSNIKGKLQYCDVVGSGLLVGSGRAQRQPCRRVEVAELNSQPREMLGREIPAEHLAMLW
ncbi:hypothetical protein, partial [Streptomyces sp. NPDC019539]|uniref:hypothetical protein n=1 Tax=Streptomyces sp. NPDC019539 TaxID=3365063 RepID=UPI0037AC6A2A